MLLPDIMDFVDPLPEPDRLDTLPLPLLLVLLTVGLLVRLLADREELKPVWSPLVLLLLVDREEPLILMPVSSRRGGLVTV